ncbi:unnamed protein product, partial [Mesorhabditis belari]|uniref:Uncharacterized protein n=1 Tax=Mesorhabditis belari TaxID=2138241 RepID=A0AAF3J1P3_9BILA
MADTSYKPELGEEETQWETLFRETFIRDEETNVALDTLIDRCGKEPKGRKKPANWTQAEINLLYELFFPHFEDWRAIDLKSANLNDPPKTTVQIDDKIKNDFKKIREKIISEENGKRTYPLPAPLDLFEELVRTDPTKMDWIKVRYLDKRIGNDPGSSSGCISLDDDSLEESSQTSKAMDPPVVQTVKFRNDDDEKDIVYIEEILNSRGAPSVNERRSFETTNAASFASTNASSSNSFRSTIPASLANFQRNLDETIEKNQSLSSKQVENEDIEKAFQLQRLANEKQSSQLIEREKMLLSLKEEVMHAKLEAARAKRRYYERKTQLTCSSMNPNDI